jgi:hypothetical protein
LSSQVKCLRTGCGTNLSFKKSLSITRQGNNSQTTCLRLWSRLENPKRTWK